MVIAVKKKLENILTALIVVGFLLMYIFMVIKAEGDKVQVAMELLVQYVVSFGVLFVCHKAYTRIMEQFDDNGTKKMNVRQIFLFDAMLVIVWVVLVISKMIENYRGDDAWGASIHFSANFTMMFYFAIITMLAIGYTIEVCTKAFGAKYCYRKETLRVIVCGRQVLIDGEVFEKRNYKGELTEVEVKAYKDGELVCATGDNEAQAVERLGEIFSER